MGNQVYQSDISLALKQERAFTYTPRKPEEGPIFKLIQNNWLKFVDLAVQKEKPPATYVVKEIEDFLGCGILAKGFLRLTSDILTLGFLKLCMIKLIEGKKPFFYHVV